MGSGNSEGKGKYTWKWETLSQVPQVINYFINNPGQLGLLMQERMDASAVKRGLGKLSVSSFSA